MNIYEESAKTLINALKGEGIIIQRYDSKTSKSIYLKLNYGVLNTIRISDHKGKKYLKYRYNLTHVKKQVRYNRENKKYYFDINNIEGLIEQIMKDEKDKRLKYGKRYEDFMEENKRYNEGKNKFWRNAELI